MTVNSGDAYANSLDAVGNAAPDIVNFPSLAMAAASSDQPNLSAQVAMMAQQQVALHSAAQNMAAQQQQGATNAAGAEGGGFNPFGNFLHYLGAPAREVSHLYRYARETFATKGLWAGMGVLLPTAVGGVLGTILAPGMGTALGAELGAEASRLLGAGNEDAYNASKDGATFQIDGKPVSFGRDVASILPGLDGDTSKGFSKLVSGSLDAAFDMGTDPVNVVGKLAAIRKSFGGVAELPHIGERIAAGNNFLTRFAPGMGLTGPEAVGQAFAAYGGFRRAVARIAQLDAGGIVHEFPDLARVADVLGAAKSAPEVLEQFRQISLDANLLGRMKNQLLPSLAPFKPVTNAVRDKMMAAAPEGNTASQLPFVMGLKRSAPSAGFAADDNGLVKAVGDMVQPSGVKGTFQRGLLLSPGALINPDAWSGAFARKWRTLTGRAPLAINSLGDLVGEFHPDDPAGWQGVYQTMRYAMGVQAARRWTTAFIGAEDPGARKLLWGEMMPEVLKAAGFPDDIDAFNSMANRARAANIGTLPHYGAGLDSGDQVNEVFDKDGNLVDRAALYNHQAGTLAYPKFQDFHNAIRDMNGWGRIYGRLDDFFAKAYTNSLFKPLNLLSGGFALREGLTEALPAMFEHGPWNYLKARIASSAAKANYKLDAGEHVHVAAVMSRLAGGATNLAKMPEEDQRLMAQLTVENQGHIVTGAVHAGHSDVLAPVTMDEKMSQALNAGIQRNMGRKATTGSHPIWGTGQFRLFAPSEGQYDDTWVAGLQRRALEPSAQQIAKDMLQAHIEGHDLANDDDLVKQLVTNEAQRIKPPVDNGVPDPYAKERRNLIRYKVQSPEDFAAARVDDMRNMVIGDDGTVHTNLLEKLAAREKPTHADIEGLPMAAKPKNVAGEEIGWAPPTNIINDLVQRGFSKVVDPVINTISREPIYWLEFKKQYEHLAEQHANGVISDEQRFMLAKQRAGLNMLDKVHIPAFRSQFAFIMRNAAPFFYAQEQVVRRFAMAIRKDPSVLAKYSWVNYALTQPSWMNQDEYGNRTLMVPGEGELGRFINNGLRHFLPGGTIGGLPLSFSGNVDAFHNLMPTSALSNDNAGFGISPLAAIPMNYLANIDPVFTKGLQSVDRAVVGDMSYNASPMMSLIPNASIRAMVEGMSASDRDVAFANAQIDALAAAYYHNKMPDPNDVVGQQKFLDQIKNNARSAFFTKAFIASLSPVGSKMSMEDMDPEGGTFRAEFLAMVKKYGDVTTATNEWIKLHGSNSLGYTVARSKSPLGVNIPEGSKPALNWVEQNSDLLGKYKGVAAFLIPQVDDNTGDYTALHQELLQTKLKSMLAPDDFLTHIYTAAGNRDYFAKRDERDKLLTENPDKPSQDLIHQNWAAWTLQYKTLHPVWADSFYSQSRSDRALNVLNNLGQMFNDGKAPDGHQTDLVRQLMVDYYNVKSQVAAMGSNTMFAQQKAAIRQGWSAYLTQLKTQQPELQDAIYSIFVPLENL